MRVLKRTQILWLGRIGRADLARLHGELGLSKTSARNELLIYSKGSIFIFTKLAQSQGPTLWGLLWLYQRVRLFRQMSWHFDRNWSSRGCVLVEKGTAAVRCMRQSFNPVAMCSQVNDCAETGLVVFTDDPVNKA